MLIIVIYQLVTSSANGRNDVSGLSHHPIVKTLASFFLVSVAISIYGQTEAATTTTTRTIPSTNYTANFSSSTPITTIASSSALRTNNGSSNTTTNIPVVVLPSITSTATARVQTSTATPSGTLRFVVFAKHSNRLKQSIQSQFEEAFEGFTDHVNIVNYSNETKDFSAQLVFNASSEIDLKWIRQRLEDANGNRSTLQLTSIQERCSSGTCGDNFQNRCITNNAQGATCICGVGFIGTRCNILKVVDGTTYGPWSNWTECKGCSQQRLRYCVPAPAHGGKCIIGQNPQLEMRTCYEKCSRDDEDDDFELVAYVLLILLVIILVMLIVFCCTFKPLAAGTKKSARSRADDTDSIEMYRVPPVIINNTHHALPSGTRRPYSTIKNTPATIPKSRMTKSPEDEYAIPMKKFTKTKTSPGPKQQAFDNLGFAGQQDSNECNEDMYRKQLELFLNEAPSLTRNGVTMESPPTPEKQFSTANDGGGEGDDSESSKPEYAVPTSFSPAIHKQREIQSKIIDRGPSWHQLSIVSS